MIDSNYAATKEFLLTPGGSNNMGVSDQELCAWLNVFICQISQPVPDLIFTLHIAATATC